jgi:hypothetical protein
VLINEEKERIIKEGELLKYRCGFGKTGLSN